MQQFEPIRNSIPLTSSAIKTVYVSVPELIKNDEFFSSTTNSDTPTLFSGSSKPDNTPFWNVNIGSESSVEAKAALSLIRDQFYREINLPIVDLRT